VVTARGVQGWQPDPFGLHEARYFSAAGQPTKLVRDRGTESYDEPPSGPDALAAARARMPAPRPAPPAAYAPQGYVPAPRAVYPPGPAAGRGPRGRAGVVAGFVASGIILIAIVTSAVLVALTVLHPKKAGTPGAGDVALVTQAATRTLQQRTADVVLSVSAGAGGVDATMRGAGAIDLGGKAGTLGGPRARRLRGRPARRRWT
jgi:hypothetical protein